MMYQKALLFNDKDIAEQVLAKSYIPKDKVPDKKWDQQMKDIKMLGRSVQNFVDEEWNGKCCEIMRKGIKAKFEQNDLMLKTLLDTGNDIICEAAPYDKIWGIGMNAQDSRVQRPELWIGKNFLGQCLMDVRAELRKS